MAVRGPQYCTESASERRAHTSSKNVIFFSGSTKCFAADAAISDVAKSTSSSDVSEKNTTRQARPAQPCDTAFPAAAAVATAVGVGSTSDEAAPTATAV
jgi:hypothetical protein